MAVFNNIAKPAGIPDNVSCPQEAPVEEEIELQIGEKSETTARDIPRPSVYYVKRFLVLCIILSPLIGFWCQWVAYNLLHEDEVQEMELAHKNIVSTFAAQLERTVTLTIKDCISLAGLFFVKEVSDTGFHTFIAHLEDGFKASNYYQALEWIPRVQHADRSAYEAAMQGRYPGYEFTENINGTLQRRSNDSVYYPVYYVYPLLGNEAAHGFDLGSSALRLEALHQAEETSTQVATSRITLVQETSKQYGLLIFTPVQDNATGVLKTRGHTLGVFRIGTMVSYAREGINEHVSLHVFDTNDSGNVLHSDTHLETVEEVNKIGNVIWTTLWVGGREWNIGVQVTPSFRNEIITETPENASVLIGIGVGIILTCLSLVFLKSIISRERMQHTLEVSRGVALAVTLMDFETVAFLSELPEKSDPLLIAFRDIIAILVEFKRFLPDALQQTVTNDMPFVPKKRSVFRKWSDHSSEHSGGSSFLKKYMSLRDLREPPSLLSLGLTEKKITLLQLRMVSMWHESRDLISRFVRTVHSRTRKNGMIMSLTGSTAQISFNGSNTLEVCQLMRAVLKEVHGTCAGITQGRTPMGVIGGEASRHFVVVGNMAHEVDLLADIASRNGLGCLCGETFQNSAVPMESFLFADRVYPNVNAYLIEDKDDSEHTGGDQEWMYQLALERDESVDRSDLHQACRYMRLFNFGNAETLFNGLSDEEKELPIVRYHLRRLGSPGQVLELTRNVNEVPLCVPLSNGD